MIKLNSMDRFVTLGSSSKFAKDDEQPPMLVIFTYDFYLDSTEVTLGKYVEVTGKCAGIKITETNKNLPVTNISWFDALLYCNALSILDNLDSVYSYTKSQSTIDGKVYNLTDLKTNFNCNGYRLPTEAEWEYSAICGTKSIDYPWGNKEDPVKASQIAWYSNNSNNISHPVATKIPNQYGFYDLLGNVMEWVNDTKGEYTDSSKVNFTGSKNITSDFRLVKGGSYRHGMEYLRPSSRSDIYDITSSTALPYIGFRCAAGAIPHTSNNQEDTSLPILPSIVTNSPLGFSSTKNVKLTFVNHNYKNRMRILCYLDYSLNKPRIHSFNDIQNVYYPTISPDGKYVAFCTNGEGLETNSSIYIRNLDSTGSGLIALEENPAFIPRWWIDPKTNDTCIIYTDKSTVNTMESWKITKTKKIVIRGGKPNSSPIVICVNGSYHDGITTNGDYIATGYTLLKIINTNTLKTDILFTGPDNGKQNGDTSQVCNVSVTQNSADNKLVFLDFGYGKTSSIVGRPYGIHEILFLMDFTGKVQQWYEPPTGYHQWDHPESSNQPSIVAVNVADNDDTHPITYALNLKTNARFKLVSGKDLLYPYLWIQQSANDDTLTINTDSLGKYNVPSSHGYQRNLACKLPVFWKLAPSLENVFVGSSRMQNGVDSRHLTNKNCYNLSYGGCGLKGTTEMINNYVLLHCKKIKLIAMTLFVGKTNQKDGDLTWSTGTKRTYGYNYDLKNDFWRNGYPKNFLSFIDDAEKLPEYPHLGFELHSSSNWGSVNPTALYAPWDIGNTNYCKNMVTLKSIAHTLEERKTHLIIVIFPMSPHFKNTDHYGLYGPNKETAHKIIKQVETLCTKSEYLHFYDAHKFGEHDYTNKEAYNVDHLSTIGAEKFTKRLDVIIENIYDKN